MPVSKQKFFIGDIVWRIYIEGVNSKHLRAGPYEITGFTNNWPDPNREWDWEYRLANETSGTHQRVPQYLILAATKVEALEYKLCRGLSESDRD